MGQKVNPHGLRVGVIKDWDSKWYAEGDFADYLVEDYNIRTFLKKKLYAAGVSKIEIERASDRVKVIIYTAKPGVVIGKGGAGINEIKAKELPELDDEFAQDAAGVDTLAEYKEEIKKNLTEKKETEAKKTKEDEAIQKIIDKSKMDLPEAMIETQCETMVEEFAQRIAQSGLTMEQYLQFSGMTVDQLKDQVRPEATTRIQSSLVLEQIAKEENIEVTDADIDAEVEKMAKAYGMEADKLKEYMGDAEKESMKKDLAITKAVDLIMDNVKERAKAKKKADAEESTEE